MRLKSVKLTNVCQHRDVFMEFPVGVTGIFGANGIGKSNLIKMIKASLTGEFPNGRQANICRLDYVDDYPKDFKSSIRTVWEHVGQDVAITRGLKPNKDKMELAHDIIHKTRDINDYVEKTFGLSGKLINEFIFVDQWSIFQFLSATPASRAKLFAHLCGTERIEKLWTALGDQIRSDSSFLSNDATSFTSLEESMEAAFKSNKKEITKLTEQAKSEKSNLIPDDIDEYERIVIDYKASVRLQELVASHHEELGVIEESLAALPAAVEGPSQLELHDLRSAKKSLESDIEDLKEKLTILKDGCPTCGHAVDSEEEYKRISKPMRLEGASKRRRLTVVLSDLSFHLLAITEAAEINDKRDPLDRRITTLASVIEENQASLEDLTTSDEGIENIQARIGAHNSATNLVAVIDSKVSTLQFENDRLVSQLEEIESKKKVSKIAKIWVGDLESLRDVFHRDSLPKLIASRFLESLVKKINETLDSFETPFIVTADDDLSFLAHKPNGIVEPAERLSGGEKVVLAIAFRLAINSLFVGEIGMMVLDEPTAGLDEHNLGCLADVLAKLCDLTKKKGQQIIMITHEARLQRVFDNVIHLGTEIYEDKEPSRPEPVHG